MAERNIGESVYQRLKSLAKEKRLDTSVLLRRYAQERLMYRLSMSDVAEDFCVKGGVLLSVYNSGNLLRPTEDIDFNGFQKGASVEVLHDALKSIVKTPVADDGVAFDLSTMTIAKDRAGTVSGGKIKIIARIHTAKVDVRVDVGFGNAITPGVRLLEMPTLLDGIAPRPTVLAYPLETVFSEKLHAMAEYGATNTRLKDFYDIALIIRMHSFSVEDIISAVTNTFLLQERDVPKLPIVCLTSDFADDNEIAWRIFLNKIDEKTNMSFQSTVEEIANFVNPIVDLIHKGNHMSGEWEPSSGWNLLPNNSLSM